MKDYLVRAITGNGEIRAFACTTRNLVEEARKIHETSPVATAALGRLLTAGSMMGSTLKGEKDLLTLTLRGDGPMEGLLVTADSHGRVKGYPYEGNVILPANSKGKLDVAGAIGKGSLTVLKDLGLKEPYHSQVDLQTGEIAEDLTYYFAISEQIPSAVGLGVLMNPENTVGQAGGFILQLLPNACEDTIAKLEANVSKVANVTSLLEQGLSPEDILEMLLSGLEPKVTERSALSYFCSCSRERVEKALVSIGSEELEKMSKEGEDIEMKCEFCKTSYWFSPLELTKLSEKSGGRR